MTSKVQIHSGSPALYQLKPQKETFGTLKRMTLGKKDPNTINKTILLVGETGTGKSTMVNSMVNYAMGVEWEDDVWFQIVEEKEEEKIKEEREDKEENNEMKEEKKENENKSQSESQTSDVIMYEIFGFEGYTLPYSLTIIDTPGFGDTRGTEQDARISKRLLDLFSSDEGVQEINVVGLVLKASENLLSDRMRYIFDSVVSLFANNIDKNIAALITHSDGVTPDNALKALKDAEIKCAKDEENEPLHFLFNNHQSKQKTKKNKGGLKHAWDFTKEQMGELTEFLKETDPQKLMTTIEVLKGRVKLTGCIQNLQDRVEKIELQQTEIQQTQEGLKKHEEEMKSNEEFEIEADEPYKEKEPIKAIWYDKAYVCTTCEENCHKECTCRIFSCDVIKDGKCKTCSGKCHVSHHVRVNWRYANKTRKVQKTLQDMKDKYEKGKAGCEKTTSLLEVLKKIMEDRQKDKDQCLEKSFELVLKLEKIALNANALSTHKHLDFLIEKMTEKGDKEKVQKLEEMKSRAYEGTRSGMRYKFSKGAEGGKAKK